MKTLNALIKTDTSITAVIDGVPRTMTSDNSFYEEALEAIVDRDIDNLDSLFDLSETISKKFEDQEVGNLAIIDSVIYYKGTPVDNYIAERIFEFVEGGLPFKPLCRFLDKLLSNPSRRAVVELYTFLENKNMPICEDGDFLAYKSVRLDYTDHYTGNFHNEVGQVLEMPRNGVCDDATNGCSEGFHAGSYEYAKSFGGSTSRLIIVKINPEDVVSVPKDCSCQKLRTARYEVVKDFEVVYRSPLDTEFSSDDYDEDDYDDGYWEHQDDEGEDDYDG